MVSTWFASGMSDGSLKIVDEIDEIVLDKLAMDSMAYEHLQLAFPASQFFTNLDDFIVCNVPGHFQQVEWEVIPKAHQLLHELEQFELELAVTPYGNADSPVDSFFAKPLTVKKPLAWLLEKFRLKDDKQYYFQSQDNNLSSLNCSAPKSLPLHTNFLGPQQAANLWIGTKGTTSRLHNDNYDNIYIQVSGSKRVYLLPPCSVRDVDEQMLEPATYDEKMQLVTDGGPRVLFPTYDPSTQQPRQNLFVVDLHEGDILFLPALWYHQVEIMTSGLNMSLNYWHTPFDEERRWSSWNMTRQLIQLMR